MTTNWLTYYPTWMSSYPTLWTNWQKTVFSNWFNIWTKNIPSRVYATENIINFQEQWIKALIEMEEQSIHKTLEAQKQLWQNYFKVLGNQNNKTQNQDLEVFPTSANLESFPFSAKTSN